jgi:hypothetical protein
LCLVPGITGPAGSIVAMGSGRPEFAAICATGFPARERYSFFMNTRLLRERL